MNKRFLKTSFVALCVLICITLTVSANGSVAKYNPDVAVANNVVTSDTINAYINSVNLQNSSLSTSNNGNIIATITFSKSMSANELKTYVNTYNIQMVQVQARGYDENNNRITFFSRTDAGIDKTYEILEEMAIDGKIKFSGVIGMYAIIDSKYIEVMQKDEKTFLLDTSANNYNVDENTTSSVYKNEIISTEKNENYFVHSVAWDIENLGLVSYNSSN